MIHGITYLDVFPPYQPRARSVLVVEDDPFMKTIFRKVLRSIDPAIRMHWATSVREACDQLSKTDFSLVISDCLLPCGPSGIALWELCKANHPDLPFLMISGLSEMMIQHLTGDEKLSPPYLQKPFLARECRERISEVLHGA